MAQSPQRRPMPPVPNFSRLIDGAAGHLLEDYLRHVRDAFVGRPAKHGSTHLHFLHDPAVPDPDDSSDGVYSNLEPSPISFADLVGDPGTPELGGAAIDHKHAIGDLAGLENLLGAIQDGVLQTSDDTLRRLLEKVLEQLAAILAALRALYDLRARSVMIDAVPTKQVAQNAASVLIVPENRQRYFMTIINDTGAGTLFLKYGDFPTITDFTHKLLAGAEYSFASPCFKGPIYGIWSAAGAGFARVNQVVRR